MKLIIGLGNPGSEYENTRHNIGYKAIDAFIHAKGLKLNKSKYGGKFHKEKDFVIAKPGTYMNNSGEFVQPLAHFFKVKPEDILIIYDDMDLKVGELRMRKSGSHGGQNGMRDIIDKLGTSDIPRLKIGIGRPKNGSKNHVLGHFSPLQIEVMNGAKDKIVKSIEMFIEKDFEKAASYSNSK